MSANDEILTLIYDAIDEVNELLPDGEKVDKSPDAILIGEQGALDSFGLVNLIVAVEQRVEEQFGVSVALADERAMSRTRSPFRTPVTLCEHVAAALAEKADA